jgi:hypothetical protein
MSLTQLVGISHFIYMSQGSNPRHSTCSPLKIEIIATRLANQIKEENFELQYFHLFCIHKNPNYCLFCEV